MSSTHIRWSFGQGGEMNVLRAEDLKGSNKVWCNRWEWRLTDVVVEATYAGRFLDFLLGRKGVEIIDIRRSIIKFLNLRRRRGGFLIYSNIWWDAVQNHSASGHLSSPRWNHCVCVCHEGVASKVILRIWHVESMTNSVFLMIEVAVAFNHRQDVNAKCRWDCERKIERCCCRDGVLQCRWGGRSLWFLTARQHWFHRFRKQQPSC